MYSGRQMADPTRRSLPNLKRRAAVRAPLVGDRHLRVTLGTELQVARALSHATYWHGDAERVCDGGVVPVPAAHFEILFCTIRLVSSAPP